MILKWRERYVDRSASSTPTQIRTVVPYADFKLYQAARKFKRPYRQFLIDHGRKWLKKA